MRFSNRRAARSSKLTTETNGPVFFVPCPWCRHPLEMPVRAELPEIIRCLTCGNVTRCTLRQAA
jgi:hypothetical protein